MLARRFARPLLASVFISGGIDTLRNPGPRVGKAEPIVDLIAEAAQPTAQQAAAKVTEAADVAAAKVDDASSTVAARASDVDGQVATKVKEAAERTGALAADVRSTLDDVAAGKPLPFETETFVKVNAAVQVGAGLLLAIGRMPRIASTALAASLVPTTLAGHRFWELEGAERKTEQIHFTKNVALLGGLILAAVDTEGRPGLAYRANHLRHDTLVAAQAAKPGSHTRKKAAKQARKRARHLGTATASVGADLSHVLAEKGQVLAEKGAELSKVAQAKGHELAAAVRDSDLTDQATVRLNELAARATQARAGA